MIELVSMFVSGVAIGGICTWIAFPHIACLLCCRRARSRTYSAVQCGLSYLSTLILSVFFMSGFARVTLSELAAFIGPFSGMALSWWAAIFFPIRSVTGVSRRFALVFPAVFVSAVFVTAFACIFPVPGNATSRSMIDLGVSAMFLWPGFLIATLSIAIYSWSSLALQTTEHLELASRIQSPNDAFHGKAEPRDARESPS